MFKLLGSNSRGRNVLESNARSGSATLEKVAVRTYVVPAVHFFFPRYKAQITRSRRHEHVKSDFGALQPNIKKTVQLVS